MESKINKNKLIYDEYLKSGNVEKWVEDNITCEGQYLKNELFDLEIKRNKEHLKKLAKNLDWDNLRQYIEGNKGDEVKRKEKRLAVLREDARIDLSFKLTNKTIINRILKNELKKLEETGEIDYLRSGIMLCRGEIDETEYKKRISDENGKHSISAVLLSISIHENKTEREIVNEFFFQALLNLYLILAYTKFFNDDLISESEELGAGLTNRIYITGEIYKYLEKKGLKIIERTNATPAKEVINPNYKAFPQNSVLNNTFYGLIATTQLNGKYTVTETLNNKRRIRTTDGYNLELTTKKGITKTVNNEEITKLLELQLKPNTVKLLSLFCMRIYETKTNEFTMSLKEYMEINGVKDQKTARNQILDDMEALTEIKINAKNKNDNIDVSLYGGVKGIKNNIIRFRFTPEFAKILVHDNVFGHMPIDIYKISTKQRPYALRFCKRIFSHKRMNAGKPNENIIKVKTLINSTPDFPKYNTKIRKYSEKIRTPFENNLEAIKKISYEYIVPHDKLDDDFPNNYEDFINASILITFDDDFKEIEAGYKDVKTNHNKKVAKTIQKKETAKAKLQAKQELKTNS